MLKNSNNYSIKSTYSSIIYLLLKKLYNMSNTKSNN
ncbi:hypothetical protein REIS_1320 [Rickettsia endosymbiont of Ixodes scapularis]|nr:hypothetical protein REIS_1320 [Rickettsia endosymbiont of Ixodes scapularis]